MRLTPIIFLALLGTITLTSSMFAQGNKPKKEEPKSSLEDARDSADKALGEVAAGVHKAIPAAKKGADEALQDVSDTVHGKNTK